MTAKREPRYAYEDPAALAWGAQLLRTARRRRLLRLAVQEVETADSQCRRASDVQGAGDDD